MTPTISLDPISLAGLRSACTINPETGQTHLNDYLAMWDGPTCYDTDGDPITECGPGADDMIVALIDELERLRDG